MRGAFTRSEKFSAFLQTERIPEMKLRLRIAVIIFAVLSMSFMSAPSAVALDKVKFPYSPISYHSLPFLVAYEAKLFEKHGLEVDPVFAGASSLIVQSMLAGEADLAGMAGPAVISNVLKGGDVIQVAALVKSFSVPLYVQPSITQIAQLSGKGVGVTRFGSVSHFTAKAILDRSNVADAVIVQTGGYPEFDDRAQHQRYRWRHDSSAAKCGAARKGLPRARQHQTDSRYEYSLYRAGSRGATRF